MIVVQGYAYKECTANVQTNDVYLYNIVIYIVLIPKTSYGFGSLTRKYQLLYWLKDNKLIKISYTTFGSYVLVTNYRILSPLRLSRVLAPNFKKRITFDREICAGFIKFHGRRDTKKEPKIFISRVSEWHVLQRVLIFLLFVHQISLKSIYMNNKS